MDSYEGRSSAEVDACHGLSRDEIVAAEALVALSLVTFSRSQRRRRNPNYSPPPPPIPVCALRWGSNRRSRYPSRVNNNPPPPTVQSPNTPLSWSGNNTSTSADEAATSGDFAVPDPSCSIPNAIALVAGGSCSGPRFKEEPKKKMSKKRKLDDYLKAEEKSLMFERSKLQKKIEVMQRFLEEGKCRNDGLKKQVMMLQSSVSKCLDLPDLNLPYANTELELGLSSSVDH